MKGILLISLALFASFGIDLKAQDLIENDDVKVLIPSELKPLKTENKLPWQFISGNLTYMVDEIKSKESTDEFLSGWAKNIGTGVYWFADCKINKNHVPMLIMETKPEGIIYKNEFLAFDNTLYKSIYKNDAKIYSFLISYPKKDSATYVELVNKIKSSISIKNKVIRLTPSESSDSITIIAPNVSFADVWSDGCSIHSPFISMITFKKIATNLDESTKEEKAFFKRTGTKKITVSEKNINGINSIILKGSGKNENHKGQCVFTTTYLFQIADRTWKVNYTIYQNCNEPVDDEHYTKIIESIKWINTK